MDDLNHWASKSTQLLQDIEQKERHHSLDVPTATLVNFMLDALSLVANRWPAGVREGVESVKAFENGTLSVTALKKRRQQCREWVANQHRGHGGWEEREVLVMELVIDAMDVQLNVQKRRLSGCLYQCVSIIKVVEPSLENPLETLLQKHFSAYFES